MRFFGQERILRELEYLLPEINSGYNTNILLVAPSGYGKTTLAYYIMGKLGWDVCQLSGPPSFYFDSGIRIHFFDEVHELKEPENIYQEMESGRFTFILATNEMGLLKEPLINRCQYPLIFELYSEKDLRNIARYLFASNGFSKISKEYIDFVVRMSNGVPRVLKNLVQRLCIIFKRIVPESLEQLQVIMRDVLNIDEQGYNPEERAYIELLERVSPASLSLISSTTGLDKNGITRFIEPNLVKRGVIKISSKGRELVL